jgi:hypothetical protein
VRGVLRSGALACSWIIFVLLLYHQGYPSHGSPDPILLSPKPPPRQGDEDLTRWKILQRRKEGRSCQRMGMDD